MPLLDTSENTRSRISTFKQSLWPIETEFRESRSIPKEGRLSAPSSKKSLEAATELNWSELQTQPESIFDVAPGDNRTFRIIPDGEVAHQLDLDGRFKRGNTHKLLVVFHGALDREKYILPRLEYQRTLEDFDGSIIWLQDPTLYTHELLTLGWYIGTELDNVHVMTAILINHAIKVLDPDQVVLTGASGGGYAALAISARIPQSHALAFSPQTAIENYYVFHRRRFVSSAFPNMDPTLENLKKIEDRIDLGALYSRDTDNRVSFVQNSADPFHIKNHCLPFMKASGLNILQGKMENDRIRLELPYMRDGHGAPRPSQLRYYVERIFGSQMK